MKRFWVFIFSGVAIKVKHWIVLRKAKFPLYYDLLLLSNLALDFRNASLLEANVVRKFFHDNLHSLKTHFSTQEKHLALNVFRYARTEMEWFISNAIQFKTICNINLHPMLDICFIYSTPKLLSTAPNGN